MIGAIAGDIIGSVHEFAGTKTADFELFHPHCMFTDDTVLAVAVADCLLHGSDYVDAFHEYFRAYPDAGFGGMFYEWASAARRDPYNSFGNGSAMRVAAVAYAFVSLDEVLAEAKRSAEVTHNHPEGVRGAQATAAAIFLARTARTNARSENLCRRCSATISSSGSTTSGRIITLTKHARIPCRRPLSRSSNRMTTRMRSARRSPSAGMPTHWLASPEESRRRSIAECLPPSPEGPWRCSTTGCDVLLSSFAGAMESTLLRRLDGHQGR